MSQIEAQFSDLNMMSGNFITTDSDHYNPPVTEVKVVELARADGNVQLLDRLKGRVINVKGNIKADTSLELRESMDNLAAYLLKSGKLRFTEDYNYREWDAKLANMTIRREPQQINTASYSLQFISEKPYAVSGYTDELVNLSNVTTSSLSEALTVYGSYPAYTAITITLNSITPTDSDVSLYIENPSTGQMLTITDTFANGDTITIDIERRLAFLNSTLISPEGDFPVWFNGAGTFSYSDNATTRDIDILVTNVRRYL